MTLKNRTYDEFFDEIKKIKDISILRDIFQFYQNEYSNFLSDSSNIEQKITGLFNLGAIFLGFFLTIIIFLIENKYFSFLKNFKTPCYLFKVISFLILAIGIMYLFMFTFKMFGILKVRTDYIRFKDKFPVDEAYKNIFFKKAREREFLQQMIYSCYKVVNKNYSLFNKKAQLLVGQHEKMIFYVILIAISLLLIIFI